MFILYALTVDTHFKEEFVYVEDTIQVYQHDTKITPTIPFSLNIEIDEIAIAIDEGSDAYMVRDKSAALRVLNPYTRVIDTEDTPFIRVLGRRDTSLRPPGKAGYRQ